MNVTMDEDSIYRHEGHSRTRRIQVVQPISPQLRRRLIELSKPSPSGNRFHSLTNEQFMYIDKHFMLRPTGLGVLPSGRYSCPQCANFGREEEFATAAERDAHLFAVTWKFILLEMPSENENSTKANFKRVSEGVSNARSQKEA
ncbi:hypothetical protein CPB85DRAFT_662278 [Mucidula mucida]|nr:hypothetical protein CPB85DRAFT_662278 [Mucidula mucida]